MNRKHNPMVALVAMLLLAVILLLMGCSTPAAAAPEEPESSPRFIVTEHQRSANKLTQYAVVTDTETGVQYLYIKSGNSGGLTVLQPAPEEVTTS